MFVGMWRQVFPVARDALKAVVLHFQTGLFQLFVFPVFEGFLLYWYVISLFVPPSYWFSPTSGLHFLFPFLILPGPFGLGFAFSFSVPHLIGSLPLRVRISVFRSPSHRVLTLRVRISVFRSLSHRVLPIRGRISVFRSLSHRVPHASCSYFIFRSLSHKILPTSGSYFLFSFPISSDSSRFGYAFPFEDAQKPSMLPQELSPPSSPFSVLISYEYKKMREA
jgi:hypothetical protein